MIGFSNKARRLLAFLLVLVLVFGIVPPAMAAAELVAQWTLTAAHIPGGTTSIAATGGAAADGATLQMLIGGVPQTMDFSSAAASRGSGLDNQVGTAWWEVNLSSAGYTNLSVSWRQRSSNTGPRDWRLEYSTDRATWHPADNPVIPNITANLTARTGTLPVGADNQGVLYVRWVIASNTGVNGNPVGGGGTTQIQDIVISGTPATDTPNVSVGAQQGTLRATEAGTVTFLATVRNIDTPAAITLENVNSVAGITLDTTTATDTQTAVSVSTSAATPQGSHPLRLNIGGTVSANFNLVVGAAPQPTLAVGAQVGNITAGEAGSVTFPVTSTLIPAGTPITLNNAPTGVTLDAVTVASGGVTTITVCTAANTPAGTHPLTVTAGSVTSAPFSLTVRPGPVEMTIAETKPHIPTANNVEGPQAIVRGTVTHRPANNTLFIQDGTGANDGIAIFRAGTTWPLSLIGQEVEVTGVLSVFNGLPQIQPETAADVRTIGPGTAFEPIDVYLSQIQGGAFMAMMVRVADIQLTHIESGSGLQNHRVAQFGMELILRATPQNIPGFSVDDWITIERGFVSSFNNPQIIMASDATAVPGTEPEERDTGNLASWHVSGATGMTFGDSVSATSGDFADGAELQMIVNGNPLSTLNWANASLNLPGGLTGQANNAWWVVNLSSLGFSDIEVSWAMRSSNTGPRDFRLQYSTDGYEWLDANSPNASLAAGNLGIADGRSLFRRSLPEGANNQPTLYIRWLMTSNATANSTGTGPGGSNSFNNIVINGVYILGDNQLRPVRATPDGGAVGVGRVVNFAPHPLNSEVPGFAAEISTDGGTTWTPAVNNQYTITALPTTLLARGTAAGMDNSRVTTHIFTQGRAPLVVPNRTPGTPVMLGTTLTLSTALEDATIHYSINEGPEQVYDRPIIFAEELFVGDPATLTITARATKAGYDDGASQTFTYTMERTGGEQVFFGMLHGHSTLSDGSGSPEEAFAHARDVAGLDFFALTDHSNWFQPANPNVDPATVDLNTFGAASPDWIRGQQAAADAYRTGEFVSMMGFEMTWSGNQIGHINTFGTGGWICRRNTAIANATGFSGLLAYYDLLERTPNSISMWTHPGAMFGTFNNFAFVNPTIRQRMALIEVGNGPGTPGGSGFFRSFQYYNMALDRGWHVAPSANDDNHGMDWGTANPVRTAIWTNDLSLEGVYNALRARRVYATEVSDLEIVFKANGFPLGTVFDEVPNELNFTADINSPTTGYVIRSVSIVTNGGVEILTSTPNAQTYFYNETLTNPAPGWYYLRVVVTTPTGAQRFAVTAPAWLGEGRRAGITDLSIDTYLPVTETPLTATATLFNDEAQNVTLETIAYHVNGAEVSRYALNHVILTGTTFTHNFTRTPTAAVRETLEVEAVIRFADGNTQTFRQTISYDVTDINRVTYIGIDGSHYNEFVSGHYSGQMTEFARMAAAEGVRVEILDTHEALIAATENPRFGALILTPPSRRLHLSLDRYQTYSAEVLDAVADFARKGNIVVVTGWSNANEDYPELAGLPAADRMAAQQNQILAAIGSTLRISDDAAADTLQHYAGNPLLMRLTDTHNAFNWDSPLLNGLDNTQVYKQDGGSTIHTVPPADSGNWNAAPSAAVPNSVTPAVLLSSVGGESRNGTRTDYTIHNGQRMALAHETVTYDGGAEAFIIAAGGSFLSNLEVVTELDNVGDLQPANHNIAQVLIQMVAPEVQITRIADARLLPEGLIVTVEGIATTNVDTGIAATNTGFFDSIYIQDESGGINLHPVTDGVEAGQLIRVTGRTSSFQGERQLGFVSRVEVIDPEINHVPPQVMTTENAMDADNMGLLIQVTGEVSAVQMAGGLVTQFLVTDDSGIPALVFINGYITSAVDLSHVQNGAHVSVIGLASHGETLGEEQARIRVRDRNEIVLMQAPPTVTGVTVTPATATVQAGATEQFTATVQGTNNPPQTVNWTVTGLPGTTIVDGLLTVAASETATSLTVTARSTHTNTVYGTATVTVTSAPPTVTGVTVTPNTATMQAGLTEQFTATVQGTNNPPQGVTWSVTGNASAETTISTSGLLAVAANETATSLTVRATSTHTNTISGTAAVTVTPAGPTTDFSVLQETLEAAHGHNRTSYTRESWAQLVTAKADAQAVLDKADATQNEVDAAVRALETAKANLVFLFPDVGAGHWGRTFVEQAFDRGFLNGNPDGTFAPYGNLTRAQVAVIML
ncbi:MAG: S-layer homology domain-containing protein, partial [Oscillospiraceae bacterium]|nr:S-layer homology domain-containing protein [Oscillospiraceae bacterium]